MPANAIHSPQRQAVLNHLPPFKQVADDVIKRLQIKRLRQPRRQGIAGVRLGNSSELIGFQLWLGALSDVTVLQQDSSGDGVPATRISDLTLVPQVRGAASFFRVHARVDCMISDRVLLAHDDTGTLFVELMEPDSVKVGSSYAIGGVLDAGMRPPILRFAEPIAAIAPVERDRNRAAGPRRSRVPEKAVSWTAAGGFDAFSDRRNAFTGDSRRTREIRRVN
jgi:hypothetical protein